MFNLFFNPFMMQYNPSTEFKSYTHKPTNETLLIYRGITRREKPKPHWVCKRNKFIHVIYDYEHRNDWRASLTAANEWMREHAYLRSVKLARPF